MDEKHAAMDKHEHLHLLRNELARLGSTRASTIDGEASELIRAASRQAGKAVALDLDGYWDEGLRTDGPIDVIDLFSGSGGMSGGFRAANGVLPVYNLVLAADISLQANETYSANLGLVPEALDIGELANDEVLLMNVVNNSRRRANHPLVLIGCAPCQGFSSHRNSNGEADSRNELFVQFATIAAKLEPDVVVIENVPELLTDRYWPLVERARRILSDSGYYVHLGVHNTAEFGVPQERFRALMLAMKHPFEPPAGFLSREAYRTVREAIGDLAPIAPGERIESDSMHYTAGHRESTVATIRAVPKDGGKRPVGVGPASLVRASQRQGRAAYEDVYGRLAWDKPSITITAYSRNPASGRFVHPEQDRGLSVREAALLQGFPREYMFSGSLDERFRQIGNAVPPIFSAYLAWHIVGELLSGGSDVSWNEGIVTSVGKSFSRLIPALKSGYRSLTNPGAETNTTEPLAGELLANGGD